MTSDHLDSLPPIVFQRQTDGNIAIYMLHFNDFAPRLLTSTVGLNCQPRWSPDKREILFLSNSADTSSHKLNLDAYIMKVADGKTAQVTHDIGYIRSAQWSPNGKRILLEAYSTDSEIYLTSPDGSRTENISNSPAEDISPTWSADGSKIAFVSNRDGNGEIYIYLMNESRLINITHSPEGEVDPSWSPDSRQIAISLSRGQNADIYIMNADGSGLHNLTDSMDVIETKPIWSPDGTKIVFTALSYQDDKKWNICVINLLTMEVIRMPRGILGPAWSPCSKWIVAQSTNGLYLLNSVDGSRRKITFSDGDGYASWPCP